MKSNKGVRDGGERGGEGRRREGEGERERERERGREEERKQQRKLLRKLGASLEKTRRACGPLPPSQKGKSSCRWERQGFPCSAFLV